MELYILRNTLWSTYLFHNLSDLPSVILFYKVHRKKKKKNVSAFWRMPALYSYYYIIAFKRTMVFCRKKNKFKRNKCKISSFLSTFSFFVLDLFLLLCSVLLCYCVQCWKKTVNLIPTRFLKFLFSVFNQFPSNLNVLYLLRIIIFFFVNVFY